jgi:hypothetical protein
MKALGRGTRLRIRVMGEPGHGSGASFEPTARRAAAYRNTRGAKLAGATARTAVRPRSSRQKRS